MRWRYKSRAIASTAEVGSGHFLSACFRSRSDRSAVHVQRAEWYLKFPGGYTARRPIARVACQAVCSTPRAELPDIVDRSGCAPGGAEDRAPLASVIMSMHNGAATVASAVRSIQFQTLRNWELIVIDDGSSDGSSEIVESLRDPRVRLIREGKRAGLAARLNQAVGISQGEFIARMDADDLCFPDRLRRQVTYLTQQPQIDLLGCGAVVFASNARL